MLRAALLAAGAASAAASRQQLGPRELGARAGDSSMASCEAFVDGEPLPDTGFTLHFYRVSSMREPPCFPVNITCPFSKFPARKSPVPQVVEFVDTDGDLNKYVVRHGKLFLEVLNDRGMLIAYSRVEKLRYSEEDNILHSARGCQGSKNYWWCCGNKNCSSYSSFRKPWGRGPQRSKQVAALNMLLGKLSALAEKAGVPNEGLPQPLSFNYSLLHTQLYYGFLVDQNREFTNTKRLQVCNKQVKPSELMHMKKGVRVTWQGLDTVTEENFEQTQRFVAKPAGVYRAGGYPLDRVRQRVIENDDDGGDGGAAAAAAAAPAPAPAPGVSLAAELREFSELRAQGVLTASEFADAKKVTIERFRRH